MAKVKIKYSRDRLIKTYDEHIQGYDFEINLENITQEILGGEMFDEVSEINENLLLELKRRIPLTEFPFGCATPIVFCDFGTSESKTIWVDHDGNEI